MINHDVEPIRPNVYADVLVGGEQAAEAGIDGGDGGADSQTREEVIEGPSEEEIQAQGSIPSPTMPTSAMRAEHKACGHLPYRSWCDHCVEAFGRERAHESGSLDERTFPLVSIDYLFLSPKGVLFKDEVKNK